MFIPFDNPKRPKIALQKAKIELFVVIERN